MRIQFSCVKKGGKVNSRTLDVLRKRPFRTYFVLKGAAWNTKLLLRYEILRDISDEMVSVELLTFMSQTCTLDAHCFYTIYIIYKIEPRESIVIVVVTVVITAAAAAAAVA